MNCMNSPQTKLNNRFMLSINRLMQLLRRKCYNIAEHRPNYGVCFMHQFLWTPIPDCTEMSAEKTEKGEQFLEICSASRGLNCPKGKQVGEDRVLVAHPYFWLRWWTFQSISESWIRIYARIWWFSRVLNHRSKWTRRSLTPQIHFLS